MSLSGYDSEAVGFDSITQSQTTENEIATQTTDFDESTSASQTTSVADFGCTTDLTMETLAAYPEGLNEFLRKVVPSVMEQLDQNDQQMLYNSSDSDDEETVVAKMFQEISTKDLSTGDHQLQVLGASWSSGGSSLAVSLGSPRHEAWCEHGGLVRVYTAKRSDGDKYSHTLDITEKNCISVVQFHPKVASLLAYGTHSGEVVVCGLQSSCDTFDAGSAMSASHEARVTGLQWADTGLTSSLLMMHVLGSKKRRLASDQVLVSSSTDGCVSAWQVNTNAKVFQNIITFKIGGAKADVDISCFDFIKTGPLRPSEEKDMSEVFVVGTTSGQLFLCNIKTHARIVGSSMVDPVTEVMEGHSSCVLCVEFSPHRAGMFASVSVDAELRVYDVRQTAPLKLICLDEPLACMSWVPGSAGLLVAGLARPDERRQHIKVYNAATGRAVPVEGLACVEQCNAAVTCIVVNQSGSCRLAAGDSRGALQVWELPLRRQRYSFEDYEF